jgi:LacI family transcriptional regulator
VPDEVSLLGFDDDRWTTIVTPRLDVLEQPIERDGQGGRADRVGRNLARPMRRHASVGASRPAGDARQLPPAGERG